MSPFPFPWALRVTLLALACVLVGAVFVAVRSYRAEAFWFQPQRHAVPLEGLATTLRAIENVTFQAGTGVQLHGWYVPSLNRAAVVMTHGSGGDRRSVLAEARLLSEAGFGVLLFDWPGHGESTGEIHWSAGERAALTAAVDYLTQRSDVDPARIGGLGFSMGGFTLTQVAASDIRLRAVALLSTPHDQEEHTRWEYRRFGPLSELPALWAIERGGLRRDELRPKDLIGRIAPRPVLIVAGADDQLVPLRFAQALHAAAGTPKALLLVPGAAHGDYAQAAPQLYPTRLRDFFARALLGSE